MRRSVFGPKLRKYIPCGYCFERWADCYDHIQPVAHGGTNLKSNLYPACRRCNMLVHARLFQSLEEKRDYIQAELKSRGEWHDADTMQRMREAIPTKPEMADLLFRPMPMECLGQEKPKERKGTSVCLTCRDRFFPSNKRDYFCCTKCLDIARINLALKRRYILEMYYIYGKEVH